MRLVPATVTVRVVIDYGVDVERAVVVYESTATKARRFGLPSAGPPNGGMGCGCREDFLHKH